MIAEDRDMNRAAATRTNDRTDADRRRARAPGRVLLTVALALALALPAIAFLTLRMTVPSDGAHLRPGSDALRSDGVVLAPLATGPLRPGDRVVGIDGVPVRELARSLAGGRPASGADASAPSVAAQAASALRSAWSAGTPVTYDLVRDGRRVRVEVPLARYPLGAAVARTWGTILFALVTLIVATLVFARRPRSAPARVLFVGAAALLGATTWSLGLQLSDLVLPAGFWLYQLTTVAIFMTYWTTILHFAAVFPEPLPWARGRGFVPVVYGVPLLGLAGFAIALSVREPEPLLRIAGIAPVSGYHAAVMLAAGLAALGWQAVRTRGGAARRQIRWVVFGALVTGSAGLFLYILPPLFERPALSPNAIGAIVTLFPLSVAVAVLRDRLFDIDALLNRTLVYGTLTLAIGAAYVTIVSLLATFLGARAGLGPSLLATGLIAVAFDPLRRRVQGVVNRVMYGERDDPAAVLGRLGQRLEGTLAADAILPTLVETVAQALRLPYVALDVDGRPPRRVAFGHPRHAAVAFPLAHQGEPIGTLHVEPRGPGEAFLRSERDLLETIARQASVAAYAVRAGDDLRRSRERLVAAREEERRRLRRDLHDGLGPALGGFALKLDATANLLERDPVAARRLIDELREQAQQALADLRSIVHALRPPTLDDLGFVGALREQLLQVRHAGVHVQFRAPDPMPPVPAGVEVAAFRIAQEALANVAKHAGARACWLRLSVEGGADGELVLIIDDDGRGMAAGRGAGDGAPGGGVGRASMHARATDLGGQLRIAPRAGGGTRVTARLPLRGPGRDEEARFA
jgi:signal transduction histidine kinase